MGKLNMQHGGQGGTEHRDEFGRVSAVMRVYKMHGCQLKKQKVGERGQEQDGQGMIVMINTLVLHMHDIHPDAFGHIKDAHPEIPFGQLGEYILY